MQPHGRTGRARREEQKTSKKRCCRPHKTYASLSKILRAALDVLFALKPLPSMDATLPAPGRMAGRPVPPGHEAPGGSSTDLLDEPPPSFARYPRLDHPARTPSNRSSRTDPIRDGAAMAMHATSTDQVMHGSDHAIRRRRCPDGTGPWETGFSRQGPAPGWPGSCRRPLPCKHHQQTAKDGALPMDQGTAAGTFLLALTWAVQACSYIS